MDVTNLNHLFNDDFVDFFDEPDMDIDNSQESTSVYLKMLQDEVNIHRRLESIQNLAKLVPNTPMMVVDKKILQYLLPASKDLLSKIFEEIVQTLSVSKSQQTSDETLKILQEHLKMCIVIHEVLDCILEYVILNEHVTLGQIQSLPSTVLPILLISFQHCKASKKIYNEYFDDIKEVVLLFKATQEVHTKLLKLLENHVDCETLLENEIILLKNVLEVLGEIGEVLVDMNMKALADNWKGYMNITQNFMEVLNQNCFNISKPLGFFSAEISRNVKDVLNQEETDERGSAQTIKLCNFFVRVVLKLCETFWSSLERICACVLDFLLSIYKFFPPFLKFKEFSECVIAQINSSVFVCLDPLLNKILCRAEFFKAISILKLEDTKSEGLLFLFIAFFQKLPTIIEANAEMCGVYLILEQFFEIMKISYSELFWKIKLGSGQWSLYDESVVNIALTVLSLNTNEYDQIQMILFKNILQDQVWSSLLATDVWCLILKKKSPQLAYETLIQIIEKTQTLLCDTFTSRPEKTFLENFMQRVYMSLPEQYKSNLVEKYSPMLNLHVWHVFGFRNFPKSHTLIIQSFLINFMEKIELLKGGRCKVSDFKFLCDGFEVVSTVSEDNEINLNYLQMLIAEVWDFKPDRSLCNNALFKLLLQKLCQTTCNFMMYFDNEQLAVILTKLNKLLKDNFDLAVQAIQMLTALSSRTFQQTPKQNLVMTNLSEMFRILLKDYSPIIREASLEVFVGFLNTTPHEKIVQDAVQSEDALQRIISNFMQKHVDNMRNISQDEYYLHQQNYKFEHVCPGEQTKFSGLLSKSKIDRDEVNMLVKRIRNDVITLHKLFGKVNVSQEHANEIVHILSKQIDYKI